MIDISEFEKMVSEILDTFPDPIFEHLNGGVIINDDFKQKETDPKDVYIMGEYICDPMLGNYIVIYYGSFFIMKKDEPLDCLKDEVTSVLKHEFLHHVEMLAGENDLAVQDELQLERFKRGEYE